MPLFFSLIFHRLGIFKKLRPFILKNDPQVGFVCLGSSDQFRLNISGEYDIGDIMSPVSHIRRYMILFHDCDAHFDHWVKVMFTSYFCMSVPSFLFVNIINYSMINYKVVCGIAP